MDLNLLIMKLKKKIDVKQNLKFYLFGSAYYCNQPNDIDLLIVHGEKYTVSEMLNIRKEISIYIKEHYGLKSDIILFSEKEAENNTFIKDEKCILL